MQNYTDVNYKKKYNALETTREAKRVFNYKKKYGITINQYNIMCAKQKGVCAACGKPPKRERLSVDHNHQTGVVRGLLCNDCNMVLGFIHEDIERLKGILQYIKSEVL